MYADIFEKMPSGGLEVSFSIFDWYLSILGCFFYLLIVESTPCNQSFKRLGFLIYDLRHILRFHVFNLVALILSLCHNMSLT